jgi:hypothetical protein
VRIRALQLDDYVKAIGDEKLVVNMLVDDRAAQGSLLSGEKRLETRSHIATCSFVFE